MQEINYEKTLFMKAPNKYLSDCLDDLPDNVYLNKTYERLQTSFKVL